MDNYLKEQLRNLNKENGRLAPDRAWVIHNREQLMSRINANKQTEKLGAEEMFKLFKGFVPQQIKLAFRPVMTVCLVATVSLVGWGASVNATYSLPGDSLYGVKRAKEITQVTVAGLVGGKEEEAKALTKVAKNRVYETQALVAQNKLEKVDETLNSMTETIAKAKENLDAVGENNPENAKTVADDLTKATGEIVATLDEVLVGAAKEGVSEEAGQVLGKIVDTQQEMATKGIEAVQVIVEKQQEGKLTLSTEEVKDLVVKTTDELVKGVASTVTSTSIVVIPVVDNTSSITSTTPATTESLNQKIDEAKQLAEGGQLLEALEKAKEATSQGADLKQEQVVKSQLPVANLPTAGAGATSTPVIASSTANNTVSQPVVVPSPVVQTSSSQPITANSPN